METQFIGGKKEEKLDKKKIFNCNKNGIFSLVACASLFDKESEKKAENKIDKSSSIKSQTTTTTHERKFRVQKRKKNNFLSFLSLFFACFFDFLSFLFLCPSIQL